MHGPRNGATHVQQKLNSQWQTLMASLLPANAVGPCHGQNFSIAVIRCTPHATPSGQKDARKMPNNPSPSNPIEFFLDCSSPRTCLAFHHAQPLAGEIGVPTMFICADMYVGNNRLALVRAATLRQKAAQWTGRPEPLARTSVPARPGASMTSHTVLRT